MRLLQHKIANILLDLYRYLAPRDGPDCDHAIPSPVAKSGVYLGENPVTMKFHRATGGVVVQVLSYSPSSNSHYGTLNSSSSQEVSSLYIIEDGKDFGKELETIVTLTLLSR